MTWSIDHQSHSARIKVKVLWSQSSFDRRELSNGAAKKHTAGSMSNKCTLATSECRDAQRAELASRGVHITLYATRDAALLLCHRYYNDWSSSSSLVYVLT